MICACMMQVHILEDQNSFLGHMVGVICIAGSCVSACYCSYTDLLNVSLLFVR